MWQNVSVATSFVIRTSELSLFINIKCANKQNRTLRTLYILTHLFLGERNKCLLALMSVLSQSFFTLVRRHLMSFFLFSAWHSFMFLDGYKC